MKKQKIDEDIKCSVCGTSGEYLCQLCAAKICSNCYDPTNNVCAECRHEIEVV